MTLKGKTLAAVCAVVVTMGGLAFAGKGAKAMKKDVVQPAASLKWADGPAKGVHVAALWGDMSKGGPYGVLLKFDAGLMHPLHSHTQNLKIVVISGTLVHKPEGGSENQLGPGSYLMQAGGSKHVSGCMAGTECEFFMSSADKFDMNMAEGAPPAKP